MGPDMEQESAAPYRLPILQRKGVAYFVDNRLQEFREVSCTHEWHLDNL
jgi:hypothetical protein